jgi:hypothetical protein
MNAPARCSTRPWRFPLERRGEHVVIRTDGGEFQRSYQGQLFEALDAPDPQPFRAFVVKLRGDAVRCGELWGSLPSADETATPSPPTTYTIGGKTLRFRGGHPRFIRAPGWYPNDALERLCGRFAARAPDSALRPLSDEDSARWGGAYAADDRGRLRAYLRSVDPSRYVMPTSDVAPAAAKPPTGKANQGTTAAQLRADERCAAILAALDDTPLPSTSFVAQRLARKGVDFGSDRTLARSLDRLRSEKRIDAQNRRLT